MYLKGILFLLVVMAISTGIFGYNEKSTVSSDVAALISGDTDGDTMLSPSVSPLSPSVSPGVTTVTKHVLVAFPGNINPIETQRPLSSLTTTPTFIITHTPSPSSVSVVSGSPSPTALSSPLATPTPMSTQAVSPTPSETPVSPERVVVNEIGWMGTTDSATDEWIELYNPGNTIVVLDGWRLDSVIQALSGTIQPGGYFLIERTNDATISDIPADMVTSFGGGGLNNAGETVSLINSKGEIMDQISNVGGWYAGDNASKASMERINSNVPGDNPENWKSNNGVNTVGHDASGNSILGTPRARNSVNP